MSDNVEIRFGTEKHRRLLRDIMERVYFSRKHQREKEDEWEDAEDACLSYMPETEKDAIRRTKREGGQPQYTTIQIPYSYATLLAAHTYWTSVFLGRSPVFQYQGRHGESEMQVQAIDSLIDYQMSVGLMLPPLYNWLYDAGKYGEGYLISYWSSETVTTSQYIEQPVTFGGIPLPGQMEKVMVTQEVPGYMGNRLLNIRPFDALPDPRVPFIYAFKGEFFGYKLDLSYNDIIKGQHSGLYYNIDTIRRHGVSPLRSDDEGGGNQDIELPTDEDPNWTTPKIGGGRGLVMYIELVPKEWRLGESDRPEIWRFTVVDEKIIVESRPIPDYHGRLPVFTLPGEIDNYTIKPRGMVQTLKPLNDTLDWLINTHFFNVRAALNNQFIYDPSKVVQKDILSTEPGKRMRLKETAYGADVRTVFSQIPVADVTNTHLRDVQLIIELIQRVSGVTDNLMGMVNTTGRRTATEVRTSSTFGINRLKTMVEYWSALAMNPLGQVLVQNTQQYYNIERSYRIAGDTLQGEQYIDIGPEQIAGFYDFVPVDGTMPVDRYAQANLWREILVGIQKMPQIGMQYDIGRIFAWMAQLAGLKNINQFKIQTVPDEQIAQQAQAGNIIPMGQGAQPAPGQPPEPGQISGMGATG